MNDWKNLLIFYILLVGCKPNQKYISEAYWFDKKIETTNNRVPESYRGLGLDFESLKASIDSLNEVILPLPDGDNIKVSVKTSSTMSEALAAKFPEIKSYTIIAENGVSGRIDVNPSGFYAMLVTSTGTYFINPKEKRSLDYMSFDKKFAVKDINNPFIEIKRKL